MKKLLQLLLCPLVACSTPESSLLQFSPGANPSKGELVVVLTRAQVEQKVSDLDKGDWISIEEGKVEIQFDDLDGDQFWDELVFLNDLSKPLKIQAIREAPQTSIPPRTNLRMGKVIEKDVSYQELSSAERVQGTETAITIANFQYEGPGWENDRIAFRNYFDERNGMDIFGKVVPEMVLDSVGIIHNYHELQPWGMDILKVGNSLGAGAIALFFEDSLYRVTVAHGGTYRAIVEGPLRSVFEMYYPAVQVGDQKVDVLHRISILAGMNGYSSEVSVSPVLPGLLLAPGIVNLETKEFFKLSLPGLVMQYTYGNQAYDGENLGMGLIVNETDFAEFYTAPEEGSGPTQSFASLLRLNQNRPTPYFFMAGWEKTDPQFGSQSDFAAQLGQEGLKWQEIFLPE